MEQNCHEEKLSSDELLYLQGGIFKRLKLNSQQQVLISQRIIEFKAIADQQGKFTVCIGCTGEYLRLFHKSTGIFAWGKKIEDFLL
ncbi:MAG: hypothetical protein RIQ54_6 [Candidatus Parcubacteria bacterium]|jgi:hypothetical protein